MFRWSSTSARVGNTPTSPVHFVVSVARARPSYRPVVPLATPAQYRAMIDTARADCFAFPAINVSSTQTLNAALQGLAEAGSDGVIQITTSAAQYLSGPVQNMAAG